MKKYLNLKIPISELKDITMIDVYGWSGKYKMYILSKTVKELKNDNKRSSKE